MGLFPSLVENRSRDTSKGDLFDERFWDTISPVTGAGIKVSEKEALKYLTVFACVSLIAGDVARLPLIVYRKTPGGSKKRVADHPLYDILHNAPNIEINSFLYREAALGHNLLWGNHYSMVERNKYSGDIVALHGIDPAVMTVKREDDGRISYRWRDWKNRPVVKYRNEMLHVPGFGFNGLVGLSMIQLAREAIGMGLAAEKFGANYFGKGTHPSGLLSMPAEAEMEESVQQKYVELVKKQASGLGNSHELMVLFNGEQYTPFTMPLNDAQFLETRDHQKVEICGFYHVPPHKIALHGQNSNYNNLEQENQSYVDSCLMHWLVRWEQALVHQLLSKEERAQGLYFEFLVEGLLRADSASRADFYQKMFGTGSMSPNDILSKENMNPVDGGDQRFIPLNMIPLDQASEFVQDKKPVEAKTIRELRARARGELRSILYRDRIVKRYYPLFKNAAEKIVSRESDAVRAQVKKITGERSSSGDLKKWLEDFYRKMPEYIIRELGPVFRSFADAIIEASIDEMGIDDDIDLERFIADYVDTYALRHVGSSEGQLVALLDGDAQGLEERVDEWQDTRPDKIASNETVRGANAIYQAVAFSAGLSTVWRIRGAETCPYCTEFDGKVVARGQTFISNGDEVRPNGQDAMKVRGSKAHPPLHQGCDCYLAIG